LGVKQQLFNVFPSAQDLWGDLWFILIIFVLQIGIFYTAIEKQWAYGAFSRNKIMYIQQQNNSYPPPALCKLL